jgi:hypothetical protein
MLFQKIVVVILIFICGIVLASTRISPFGSDEEIDIQDFSGESVYNTSDYINYTSEYEVENSAVMDTNDILSIVGPLAYYACTNVTIMDTSTSTKFAGFGIVGANMDGVVVSPDGSYFIVVSSGKKQVWDQDYEFYYYLTFCII